MSNDSKGGQSMGDQSMSGEPTDEDGSEPVGAAALHRWSESLASIAKTGLGFTENNFEAERYEEILAVAADIRVAADELSSERSSTDLVSADELQASWLRNVGSGVPGYVTPKVAIGAVVGDDQGRLLLIQRADSGVWLYPTGWADVGYSPSEVAIKEVQEETGITCEVIRPLAILDGLRAGFSRVPLYSLVFLCRAVGGTISPHPQECLDAGWFGRDELPEPLASFDRWGEAAFAAIEGNVDEVLYDEPRNPVWRGTPEHP
ncbi:MAG: NUDIX hydrolase N-terminal domain-containing protein [Acidimicrobiales bacterium]